ncbi:MAG: bifunctional diguanylate cyclase/phosphodiesterase [Lachnospiraceae bacterium]|nr:bifunctional diguanylate cyclase/phosphodiesterase [Lachnospiraceae bacterium]
MKKDGNGKEERGVLEKTLDSLAFQREAPKGLFFVLVILYVALSVAVRITSTSQAVIMLGQNPVPLSVFTGVFSTVSNLCIILMVFFCGKAGFVTSIIILVIQYPMLLQGIIVHRTFASIPGLFGNLLTIIVVITIYLNNKKLGQYQQKLREQATTDLLTGLPNTFASTELVHELTKQHKPFAAVSIDIDGINSINNTMGYDMGNKVLIEVASRWKRIADEGRSGTLDFISRINGDEFSLIIRRYHSLEDIENTIRQYYEAVTDKINIEGYDFSLTASFGYAVFPFDADEQDTILSCSYAAMREIKRLNNGEHTLRFNADLFSIQNQLIIENKIRYALENDLIYVNLQPQFDMSHRLRGFEALARMKDRDGHNIRPDEFIPAAERLGLVSDVDLAVHKKATAFFRELLKKTASDITLSINVSVKHLMKSDFVEEIRALIQESGIPAKQLEIEITESVLIESAEKAARSLTELKALGLRIAIDDFGTGYSSLSYLKNFPSDVLKIDKSFIDDINTGAASPKYVEAIISLAHVMDLEVVAEGVEVAEQLETLRSGNCDYIQGYIWGQPLSPEDAEELALGIRK